MSRAATVTVLPATINYRHNNVIDALEGKIDLIITKSVSRFARNTYSSFYWCYDDSYNWADIPFCIVT